MIRKMIINLKRKFYRYCIYITINPFQVSKLWRKLGVVIGENTCIYRNVVLGGEGKEPIIIGNNCVLTGCTLLPHDASVNPKIGINYGERSPTKPIIIKDNCFIGYGSIILMGVTIGPDSIIGAGSVVTKDVPPGMVYAGNPARAILSVEELVKKRQEEH